MQRQMLVCISISIFLLANIVYAIEPDGPIARDVINKEVLLLVKDGQYKQLEYKANNYRENKELFPDGAWKLLSFYESFYSPGFKNDKEWIKFIGQLEQWEKQYQNSPTPKLALATAWMGYGWFARGSKFQINSGAGVLLTERLNRARKILSNKSLIHSCPEYYQLKLKLALADGVSRDKYEQLLEEAIKFEPTYLSYYSSAITYYSNEWFGENEEWVKQLDRLDRIAPKGTGIYVRLAYVMMPRDWKRFDEGKVSWERLKKSLSELPKDSPWIKNLTAAFACQAGDIQTARQVMTEIGETPYYKAWSSASGLYNDCRKKAGLSNVGWQDSMEYRYLNLFAQNGNDWAKTRLETNIKNGMAGYPRHK